MRQPAPAATSKLSLVAQETVKITSQMTSRYILCKSPDQGLNLTLTKFGGSVAEATIDIRMQFVRKVYAILYAAVPYLSSVLVLIIHSTVQLLATSVLSSISFFSTGFKTWIQSNQWMMWVSVSHSPHLFGFYYFIYVYRTI